MATAGAPRNQATAEAKALPGARPQPENTTPRLPKPPRDAVLATYPNWIHQFWGFLYSKSATSLSHAERVTAIGHEDNDVIMTGSNDSSPPLRFIDPHLEVNAIITDGNCYFGACASVLYGNRDVLDSVRVQHQAFLRQVIANPQHPRHASYKRWSEQAVDPQKPELTNMARVQTARQYQSATLAQVTADMYGVMIAILEESGPEEKVEDRMMKPLQVTALYGHPSHPLRLLCFDRGLEHFSGVRPVGTAGSQIKEYSLPTQLASASRPWKEFLPTEKGGDGIPEPIDLPMFVTEHAGEPIQLPKKYSDTPSIDATTRGKAEETSLRGAATAIKAPSATRPTNKGITNPLTTTRPQSQCSITGWRHREEPDVFWKLSCSYKARVEDKAGARKFFDRPCHADVRLVVEGFQAFEVLCLEQGYDDSTFNTALKALLKRATGLSGWVEPDRDKAKTKLGEFAKIMHQRNRRLQNFLLGPNQQRYAHGLARETSRTQDVSIHFLMKLALYELARFHVHQYGKQIEENLLTEQLATICQDL